MTTLVFVSQVNDLLLAALAQEKFRSDLFIIATEQAVPSLVQNQYEPVVLNVNPSLDWEKRDKLFATMAMPGLWGDSTFPDSELPLWSVMGLDRLYFWFAPDALKELEIIESLNVSKAIVSLDSYHYLPWAIARRFPTVGVQVEHMNTLEWKLLEPYLDTLFTEIIRHPIVEVKSVSGPERIGYRKGLGIDPNESVSFVPFDLRTEHEFGRYLAGSKEKILVWPVGERASEKLLMMYGNLMRKRDILIVDYNAHVCADQMIAFREDSYTFQSRIPVKKGQTK